MKYEIMNKFEVLLKRGYKMTLDGQLINPVGRPVKGYVNTKKGYSVLLTGIRINGSYVSIPFHKFQAYLKFGNEIFIEGIEVRHLDGNSLNNSYENISIGNHSQNMMDIPLEIRKLKSSKANLKYDHRSIINDRNKGMKYSELMEKYSISSKSTISHIINKSYSANPRNCVFNLQL